MDQLPEGFIDALLYGNSDRLSYTYQGTSSKKTTEFKGIITELERRYYETQSMNIRMWLESFQSVTVCKTCGGNRLRPDALAVTVGGLNIMEITKLSVRRSIEFFDNLKLSETEAEIARQIRLRDIGGIILIDFIDMYSEAHKKKIIDIMKRETQSDRSRVQIEEFTKLNLLELTRKHICSNFK